MDVVRGLLFVKALQDCDSFGQSPFMILLVSFMTSARRFLKTLADLWPQPIFPNHDDVPTHAHVRHYCPLHSIVSLLPLA